MHLRLLDNSNGERDKNSSHTYFVVPDSEDFNNLQKIANVNLKNPEDGILLFPQSFENFNDDRICRLSNDGKIETNNTMGFVGYNGTHLTIASRFAQQHDYFLHYMLQKVLAINAVNLDLSKGSDDIQDFLPYLFPMFLQKALAKGLFKKYRYNEYNDANVRGVLDVSRHIRINIPFAGKVAYRTREHSRDNPVTQLVRHTIEHLRIRPMWHNILNNNPDTRANVSRIEQCTPTYARRERRKVIAANHKQVNHPYFTEYRNLQKLCLQILRHEKTSFDGNKDEIYGILFDGAWLWEEYIAKVFEGHIPAIKHKTNRDKLFLNDENHLVQGIVPDFIIYRERPYTASFIADTKYKHIDTRSNTAAREDYYQVITYMYRYECKTGYILFPCMDQDVYKWEGRIANTQKDSSVIELGLPIPQNEKSFSDFRKQIVENEKEFLHEFSGGGH